MLWVLSRPAGTSEPNKMTKVSLKSTRKGPVASRKDIIDEAVWYLESDGDWQPKAPLCAGYAYLWLNRLDRHFVVMQYGDESQLVSDLSFVHEMKLWIHLGTGFLEAKSFGFIQLNPLLPNVSEVSFSEKGKQIHGYQKCG